MAVHLIRRSGRRLELCLAVAMVFLATNHLNAADQSSGKNDIVPSDAHLERVFGGGAVLTEGCAAVSL